MKHNLATAKKFATIIRKAKFEEDMSVPFSRWPHHLKEQSRTSTVYVPEITEKDLDFKFSKEFNDWVHEVEDIIGVSGGYGDYVSEEELAEAFKLGSSPEDVANWITNMMSNRLQRREPISDDYSPEELAGNVHWEGYSSAADKTLIAKKFATIIRKAQEDDLDIFERARLDEDRTAKPKTRIVHHPHVGDRFGPGMELNNPEYEDESGERTSLDKKDPFSSWMTEVATIIDDNPSMYEEELFEEFIKGKSPRAAIMSVLGYLPRSEPTHPWSTGGSKNDAVASVADMFLKKLADIDPITDENFHKWKDKFFEILDAITSGMIKDIDFDILVGLYQEGASPLQAVLFFGKKDGWMKEVKIPEPPSTGSRSPNEETSGPSEEDRRKHQQRSDDYASLPGGHMSR